MNETGISVDFSITEFDKMSALDSQIRLITNIEDIVIYIITQLPDISNYFTRLPLL